MPRAYILSIDFECFPRKNNESNQLYFDVSTVTISCLNINKMGNN